MHLTKRITHAIHRAAELHAGQVRKDGVTPILVHPLLVAEIVSDYTDNEDVVITAILHDTVEDTSYTLAEAKQEFGEKIGGYLAELSEKSMHNGIASASWEERKHARLKQLESASPEAMLVFAADKIHNLRTLIDDYAVAGEKLWERFHAPKDRQLWYAHELLQILERRLQSKIVDDLAAVYQEAVETFK